MFALEVNYLKILKYCWLLIIFLPTFFAYEDGSLCESTLEFLDCSDEPEERLVISRRIRNTFYVKYIPGDKCKFKEVAYHWGLAFANGSMKLYEEYHKKDYVFVVEPFTLTYHSQPYYLMFVVYEMYKNTKKIGELKAACSFEVSRENPIPIIKGGLEISVDSGKDIVIDGAGSIDLEVPHGQKGHLQFKWSCTVSDDKLSEFCQKNLGKNSMVKIPARYAVHNSIYTFTLSVKSRESDWQSTNQKVNIFTGASSIEIICEKNCPPDVPVSNAKQVTIFEVKCKVNCKNINSNLYKWSINSDFSYESATKFGRQGPVFYIYEKILTEGQTYEVSVEITNEQGEIKGKAARSLTFHESPTLGQCSIEPAQGEALSTLFRVHCSHKKGVYTFEVYSVTEKSETLLARSILLGNIEFVLSAGVHVLVKMIDPYEFNDIQFLTVDVTDTLNPEEKSLDKQLTKRYYDKKSKFSIVNLLANKKYYELMQLLNVFADELEQLSQNANFKKTASLYKNKLLTALQSIPLTDVYLCKQAASIATKISLDEIGHQNPNVAWKATAVCVDAAKKTLDHYNKVQFVGSFAEEISDTGGLFAECTQVGLSTNHDVLKTRHILTTLSTPYPLLKIHAITEHYPDYFDDEGVSRNKMKLERSCQNLISLCALSTELLVTPLSPYQDGSISKYDLLEVIAIKKFGKDLQDFSISSLGTEVQPSKDFLNSKEVEISMCTTETNPFISINKEKIESPIAIIQFRSKKVITSFHHPFTISFKYAVNDSRYITHKGTTLRHTGKTKTKEDGKFEAMTMFQIDVIRNQSYFIVFTEFSQSINIYVTKFYKPTPAEFEDKCTEITEVGKTIFIENTMDYDHWDYLTVVPSTGKAKVNFKFRVFTYSCSSWQVSTRSWTNACGSSNESNSEKIVCKCYHSSVFSGKMKNNPVKEEHTLYTQHKLEVQASFIIFLSVLVLWILYCAFLTYLSFVKEKYKRQDIYFLSDIPSFYRYGYLVIVKTGNTGTTSNVMMKIYGTNTESKEHVLNFPDPDKKILRKGQEDWFFFATQYYLGDIKKIEIWFDSVGYRPSWECLEIEVVDLQLQKNWLFEINFKFDIKNSENHVFTAKPRNTERLSKRGIFLKKMKTGFRGPHPWNIFYKETSLSNIERLTIMLSIFITIYNIVLMFYGLPAFKQNDGLDYFCEYQFDAKIIWATVAASILTFLIHYPLVYLLRLRSENGGFQKHPKLHKYLIDVSNRICWFILIFIILVSMTMTLLFGFWVPHITSLMWLTTSIASVLVYSFLLENLARLIKGFLQKGNTRMKKIFSKSNTILHYVEAQRNNFYNMFGRISLRPYFKKVYKPLDKESVKERQHWEKQKEKLIETFEDIIMIGIYVFLLYIILVRDKDPMANISNLEMRDLIRGHHSNTYSEHILSTKEIQNYIQNTLIPSMQSPQWYDRYIAKDPGSLTDNSNKYIGIARLRQKRADNISCAIPSSMKFATNSCVSPFSTGPEYRTFSQKWGHISGLDGFSRLEFIWDYQNVLKTGTLGYTGKFASYSGGGYVAPLGRTMRNSYINFRFYKRNVWIDERTRCLFIEFLTYSANSNLFNNVKIIFEISPSGYILPNYRAQTAKLLLVGEESNAFTLIVLTFFSLIVISLSIRSINDIRKKKAIVFKDFWRLVDIVLITMTLICLFLYLKRSHEVGEFLNRVKQAKHNKFINYFYLFYAESALTTLAAILVFLATFRLWKLLRFMVIIKVVEKTLDIAAKFLLCLFILHLHLLLIFASAGYLLFGNQYYSFDSFPNSFMNLVLISLGFHSFDFESAASTLFLLFYCSYMIMSIIFLTVYITLITIYYGEAQRLYSDQQEYNVLNYVKGQCYYYKELAKVKFRKCRLKGGQDENWERKKHVFPKSDEHRYAKCLTLEKCKLRAMRQIALDCLRNFKPKAKFTEEDAELIKGTIVQMFKTCNDESKAIFFLSNLVGWKTKLIDDEKFLKMENILNILLDSRPKIDESNVYETVINNNDILLKRIEKNLKIVSNGLNCIVLDD